LKFLGVSIRRCFTAYPKPLKENWKK